MQNTLPPGDEQQPPMERRLATIMMADVAGYSRMMGKDEERTVQMLRGHRQVIDALLAAHRGRIFNTAGDAILAEFPSAVEAVRCATEIQSALRTRNEKYPEEERMWFRIGINLGDVIVQGTDLLGDGVNVAARIQTIAEPGGVCISGSVYDQILNKLSLQFTLMGERTFKNIARPVRTFSITEAEGGALPLQGAPNHRRGKDKMVFALIAGLCGLVVVAALTFWLVRTQQADRADETRRVLQVERQAAEAKRLAAEAEKTRAEQERQNAEEALRREREARFAAEAEAAREALARTEAEKKRLAQELRQREAGQHPAQAAPEPIPEKAGTGPLPQLPAAAVPPEPASPFARFAGSYAGNLCNDPSPGQFKKRCWAVRLEVAQGDISAEWPVVRLGKTGRLRGTISAAGEVAMTLDGWNQEGKPTSAGLKGKWENNAIHAAGKWRGGRTVTGDWRREE